MSWMSRPSFTSPIVGSSAQQDNSLDSQMEFSDAEHSPGNQTGDARFEVSGGASSQGSRPSTESSGPAERSSLRRKRLPRLNTNVPTHTSSSRKAPGRILRDTNPDPLSSGSEKAIQDGKLPRLAGLKAVFPPQRTSSLIEDSIPNRSDTTTTLSEDTDDAIDPAKQILDMSAEADEIHRIYAAEILQRDSEIESLRSQLAHKHSREEDGKYGQSLGKVVSPSIRRQDKDSYPNLMWNNSRQPEHLQNPQTVSSNLVLEIRKMTVKTILERAEVARLLKDWDRMDDLAALAIEESQEFGDPVLRAKGQYCGGIALYHLKLYYEASMMLEAAIKNAPTMVELTDMQEWLEKTNRAVSSAHSTTFVQSSPFPFAWSRARTTSSPAPGTPGALKSELQFDSDFGSIQGLGSMPTSARSFTASGFESPQMSQGSRMQSVDWGAKLRNQKWQERTPITTTSFTSPFKVGSRRTSQAVQMPSPLVSQKSLPKEVEKSLPHEQRPFPGSAMSSAMKKPIRPTEPGRARSYNEETSPPKLESTPFATRPRGETSVDLRKGLLDLRVRKQSQHEGLAFPSSATKVRFLPDVAQPRLETHNPGRNSKQRRVGESYQVLASNKEQAKVQEELDEIQIKTSRLNKVNTSPEEFPMRSDPNLSRSSAEILESFPVLQNDKPSSTAEATFKRSSDEEIPFREGEHRRTSYAVPPGQNSSNLEREKEQPTEAEDHCSNQSKGSRTSLESQAGPNRDTSYLSSIQSSNPENSQKADKIGGSSSRSSSQATAGARDEDHSAFTNDDDLYGVENGYVPPSARDTSNSIEGNSSRGSSSSQATAGAREEYHNGMRNDNNVYGDEDDHVQPDASDAYMALTPVTEMPSDLPEGKLRNVDIPSRAEALTHSAQIRDAIASTDNHTQNIKVPRKQKHEAQEDPKSTLPILEATTQASNFGEGADESEEAVKDPSHSAASSLQDGKTSSKKKRRRKRGNNGR